jgi:ketosteroid isomerase-like protein
MSVQAQKKIEIVTDFMNSIGKLDIEGAGRHLAENAVMVIPYLESMPALEGKANIIRALNDTVPKMYERMEITYDAWYPVSDSDVLITEYRSYCPLRGKSGAYRNVYISVVHFENDKITLYKEYLNPLKINAVD